MESDGPPHLSDCESFPLCPSFNSYTSRNFVDIASKVADEASDCGGDDFEFAFVRTDSDATADEIFGSGGVGEVFPVFNRDLLAKYEHDCDGEAGEAEETIRLPLRKLFLEEREDRDPPSSSSSEVDELESVPQGTYCVWRPKAEVAQSPNRCEKSKSTGSVSKKWNFRDLLRRSNSDGKEAFVFFTPKNRDHQKAGKIEAAEKPKERRNSGVKAKGAATAGGGEKMSPSPSRSAHEAFYVQNRASREGEKKKSYLPYRKDLVGFFANVHGMGRTFPPF